MNKKTLILTTFSFLYSGVALATTPMCGPTPSCEDLGFLSTIASSCKHVLYCPFDTNYKICVDKCRALPEKGDCAIGDIYYSDGTCSSIADYNASKKAVGVVFMLTDEDGNIAFGESSNHGRVVNLHDLYAQDDYFLDPENPYSGSQPVYWGSATLLNYTLSSIDSPGSIGYALKAADGQEGSAYIYTGGPENTATMASSVKSNCTYEFGTKDYAKKCTSPVARAALAFYPPNVDSSDPIVGAGKWYLPSMGELVQMYGINIDEMTESSGNSGATGTTYTAIDKTFAFLVEKIGPSNVARFSNTMYWSSFRTSVWPLAVNPVNGKRAMADSTIGYHTRVVLAF